MAWIIHWGNGGVKNFFWIAEFPEGYPLELNPVIFSTVEKSALSSVDEFGASPTLFHPPANNTRPGSLNEKKWPSPRLE
jgi:hypothetical protein